MITFQQLSPQEQKKVETYWKDVRYMCQELGLSCGDNLEKYWQIHAEMDFPVILESHLPLKLQLALASHNIP